MPGPTFAQQRLVAFALILGMAMATAAVAVVLQANEGRGLAERAVPSLDTVVLAAAPALALGALFLRRTMQEGAAAAPPEAREMARFRALLLPLAMIEGGCMLALVAWLVNGKAVPSLVVALVLLSLAIVIVPIRDPDEE